MSLQTISPASRKIETQFEEGSGNLIHAYLRDETARKLESNGLAPSEYDVYLVRRNQFAGDDAIGPKTLHAGRYSEDALYGAGGSPIARFRSAVQALNDRSEKALSTNSDEVEYGHQSALVWVEVGRLKEFIGISPAISEIVAEFRTARFQFLSKDTPPTAMRSIALALRLVAEAKRLDTTLVDCVVEALANGGIDSFAPDSLRDSRG